MTSRKSPNRDGSPAPSSPDTIPASRLNRNLSVPSLTAQLPNRSGHSHQRSASQQMARPESERTVTLERRGITTAAAAAVTTDSKLSPSPSLHPIRTRPAVLSRLCRQSGGSFVDLGQAQGKQSPAGTPRRTREAGPQDEFLDARNVKARSSIRQLNASQTTIQGQSAAGKKSCSQSTEEGSPGSGTSSDESSSYSGPHRRRDDNYLAFCVDYGFSLALKKGEPPEADRLTMFRKLAAKYNQELGTNHPRMLQLTSQIDGTKWCSVVDEFDRPGPASLIILSLRTPMMSTMADWYGHIEATWKFLEENYRVNINCPLLDMEIGVSLRGYNIDHLVRFVQAAIHFEPAIWAMTPQNKCKRNYDQNPEFDIIGRAQASDESSSRAAAVTAIEKICRKMTAAEQFLWLFKTFTPENKITQINVGTGAYLWNIAQGVPGDIGGALYVMLFVPMPLATGGESEHTGRTNWPRFTLSFLRSAMSCVSGAQLKRYTSDAAGLRKFMGGSHNAVFGPSDKGILGFVDVESGKPVPAGNF